MGCPMCRSEYLIIRQRVGWEWIMKHFTPKRKYHLRVVWILIPRPRPKACTAPTKPVRTEETKSNSAASGEI